MAVNETCSDKARPRNSTGGLSERDLMGLQKPAQYLGRELNSVVKDEQSVEVRMALAFPDTYEVGMSHTGIQILYHIINGLDYAWAERCYMPLPDLEQLLRKSGSRLTSLESKRPLDQFDILGFSLQYELCMTNVLAMLELGGIPLHSASRSSDHPLVIGGGPLCYHPEPIAPFFDAFFLGDAEEGAVELVQAIRDLRRQGRTERTEILQAISRIEGVYLPSQFQFDYCDAEAGERLPGCSDPGRSDPDWIDSKTTDSGLTRLQTGKIKAIIPCDPSKPQITRRLLANLDGAPYPDKPVVPNIKTVHNRLNVEVMRGCVRGCRFCQAGYLYRPQRERSPEEILKIIDAALPTTGFEEISLLSLSTADYCSIVPLLKAVMGRYGDEEKVAVSFPSTRVDALTPEVLSQVQRVRRTGFTLAPEAGTQRLRDVINKGVTDEQIVETCKLIFKMGWNGVKLYFMIGLPTETDEDLQGIIDTARRVRSIGEARSKDITVSVSTFVPKPHTPFQWSGQISPAETIRRQRLLAGGLRQLKVNFRYHDSFSTFLEGVFCRADRRMSAVIRRAYELGCRLDAWDEHLRQDLWMQAFSDCNIDPAWFLRARDPDELLPWDHLSCGIPKSYFLKEQARALRDKTTPDCLLTSCSICGACDYDSRRNVLWPRDLSEARLVQSGRIAAPAESSPGPMGFSTAEQLQQELPLTEQPAGSPPGGAEPVCRIRLRYKKSGALRYFGHLEMTQLFHRAARRSGLPVAYSLGFHPMPRFAFGPPLQLGVGSSEEYFDLFLVSRLAAAKTQYFLNQTLDTELAVVEAWEVPLNAPSLQDSLGAYRYRVEWISAPGALIGRYNSGELSAAAAAEAIRSAVIERTGGLTAAKGAAVHPEPNAAKFSDTDSPEAVSRDRGPSRSRSNGKGRERSFILGQHTEGVQLSRESLEFTMLLTPSRAAPRLTEIIQALSGLLIGDYTVEKVSSSFRPGFDRRVEPQPSAVLTEPNHSAEAF